MEGLGPAVQNRSAHKGSKSNSSYYVGPAAPLGVAPVFSNARKEEGQKLLTTSTGRIPIQPAICGIPSSHMSLRSPAALDKTREVFLEQQKQLWLERQQRPRQKQNFHQQGKQSSLDRLGGQPKHYRLQPLGVVDSDVINPEEVLGVLPVRLQNSGAEDVRPKSCVAPRMTSFSERNAAVLAKVKPRKRSYSAILSHQLSGDELGEMLYVSRHMALVPQGEQGVDDRCLDLQSLTRTLPSVVGNNALRNKSKVKSLRQGRHCKVKIVEAKNDETSSVEKLPPIGPESSGEIINIKITTSSSNEDVKVDNADSRKSPASSQKANGKSAAATENIKSPRTLSPKIVSIGEAKETEKAAIKKKHHPSSGVKGHLSQGWSSPQPIKGLTGNPLHASRARKEASRARKEANRAECKDETESGDPEATHRASTPGMMVNINISEFLGTDSEPENAQQDDGPPGQD